MLATVQNNLIASASDCLREGVFNEGATNTPAFMLFAYGHIFNVANSSPSVNKFLLYEKGCCPDNLSFRFRDENLVYVGVLIDMLQENHLRLFGAYVWKA